jgi:hypothetical protein
MTPAPAVGSALWRLAVNISSLQNHGKQAQRRFAIDRQGELTDNCPYRFLPFIINFGTWGYAIWLRWQSVTHAAHHVYIPDRQS